MADVPTRFLLCRGDRLFQFQQWQANLRILDVEEIKTVPYAPLSHPFVERHIGHYSTGMFGPHPLLDGHDLEMNVLDSSVITTVIARLRDWRANSRHRSRTRAAPAPVSVGRWQPHCRGLYHTPLAA